MTYDKMAIEVARIATLIGSDELTAIVTEYRIASVKHVHTWNKESLSRLRDASVELHDAYKENRR